MNEQYAIAAKREKHSGARSHWIASGLGGITLAMTAGTALGVGFDLAPEAERTDALLVRQADGSPLSLSPDGVIDLVVGNNAPGIDRIYFGNGDGTFTENPMMLSGTTDTGDFDAGDINGDGDIDLVEGTRGGVNNFYLGDGAGNFGAASPIGAETDLTSSVELADMDNDGDLDVVVGNTDDQINRVYLNTTPSPGAAPTFAAAVNITADADYSRDAAAGDVDGDGDLDVIAGNDDRGTCANCGTQPTKVYVNTLIPTTTFGFAAGIPVAQSGASIDDLELADLDGDTDLDLVAVSFGDTNRFFINQLVENGTFSFDMGTDISPDTDLGNAGELADIDVDGDLDLVVGNGSTPTPQVARLYLNQFVESGSTAVAFDAGQDISTDARHTRDIVAIDLDGINGPDVIAGNRDQINRVYLNNGTATPFTNVAPAFTSTPVTDAPADAVYTYDITTADPDPDDTGDTLTITAPTLPPWLAAGFTANGDGTATLTGTPTAAEVGDHLVSLLVEDDEGLSTPQDFTITVAAVVPGNDPPTFTSTAVTDATEGQAYSYAITTSDPNSGDTLTITSTTIPAWLTLTDNGDGTATLAGTPAASDVGDDPVSLRVEDQDGAFATQDFTITVAAAGSDTTPPVITLTGPATVNVTVGSVYNDMGATATDDVDGDLTAAIVTNNNVDTSAVGTYTVTYDVSDAAGNAAMTVTRTVNVSLPRLDDGGGGALGLWPLVALLGFLGAARRRRQS